MRKLRSVSSESGYVAVPSGKVWIGGNARDTGHHHWKGKIDEVAIFERALTASEIQTLYEMEKGSSVTVLSWDP